MRVPSPCDLVELSIGLRTLHGDLVPSDTAVESDQPEFSWYEILGARYVVTVFNGDEVVAQSGPLAGRRWKPERPLTRGRTYAWQVRAIDRKPIVGIWDHEREPPADRPRALFRVLAKKEVQELAAARRRHPHDHRLLGILAAKHGLRVDATRELAQYSVEHPSAPIRLIAKGVR